MTDLLLENAHAPFGRHEEGNLRVSIRMPQGVRHSI